MGKFPKEMCCNRMSNRYTYQVAGNRFDIFGERLYKAVEQINGFKPFETTDSNTSFSFVESRNIPEMKCVEYRFTYEDVNGFFGFIDDGYMLILQPGNGDALYMWHFNGTKEVQTHGNYELRLYRFALWVGYGLMVLPLDTVAIHSSCIVYRDKAVLFLGESGTGKSTHTRLWREYIDGAFLLNDDSPIIRVEDGRVWAYGSPWSGKTPCYKPERYELKGCVRLSQAPYNQIRELSVLQSYGAIHPSCPPEFAYDNRLYDHISRFLNKLIANVPFYHLACLPNSDGVSLSCRTLFPDSI